MRFKKVVITAIVALALSVPVFAANAENVALAVGEADIYASVPLCTYWCLVGEQSVTPIMVVTNHGQTSVTVSAERLPDSISKLAGVPCEIMPSMRAIFTLSDNPSSLRIQKRAVKQAVIFTISKTGG